MLGRSDDEAVELECRMRQALQGDRARGREGQGSLPPRPRVRRDGHARRRRRRRRGPITGQYLRDPVVGGRRGSRAQTAAGGSSTARGSLDGIPSVLVTSSPWSSHRLVGAGASGRARPGACEGTCERPIAYTLNPQVDADRQRMIDEAMRVWGGGGLRVRFSPGGRDLVIERARSLRPAAALGPGLPQHGAHEGRADSGSGSRIDDPGEARALICTNWAWPRHRRHRRHADDVHAQHEFERHAARPLEHARLPQRDAAPSAKCTPPPGESMAAFFFLAFFGVLAVLLSRAALSVARCGSAALTGGARRGACGRFFRRFMLFSAHGSLRCQDYAERWLPTASGCCRKIRRLHRHARSRDDGPRPWCRGSVRRACRARTAFVRAAGRRFRGTRTPHAARRADRRITPTACSIGLSVSGEAAAAPVIRLETSDQDARAICSEVTTAHPKSGRRQRHPRQLRAGRPIPTDRCALRPFGGCFSSLRSGGFFGSRQCHGVPGVDIVERRWPTAPPRFWAWAASRSGSSRGRQARRTAHGDHELYGRSQALERGAHRADPERDPASWSRSAPRRRSRRRSRPWRRPTSRGSSNTTRSRRRRT